MDEEEVRGLWATKPVAAEIRLDMECTKSLSSSQSQALAWVRSSVTLEAPPPGLLVSCTVEIFISDMIENCMNFISSGVNRSWNMTTGGSVDSHSK